MLDEFQEVDGHRPGLPRLMRSVFQRQPEVAHLYLGSRRHTMERIFSDENEPFWRSAKRMELGAIAPEQFRPFIARAVRGTGKAIEPRRRSRSILATTGGHPYATQELCYFRGSALGRSDARPGRHPRRRARRRAALRGLALRRRLGSGQLPTARPAPGAGIEEGRPLTSEYRRRHGLPRGRAFSARCRQLERGELVTRDGAARGSASRSWRSGCARRRSSRRPPNPYAELRYASLRNEQRSFGRPHQRPLAEHPQRDGY